MKGFFKTKTAKVFTVIVVILVLLIIFTASISRNSMLSNMLGFTTSPMQKISVKVTDEATEFFDLDSYTKEELKNMNQQLASENRKYREQLIEYYDMQKENDLLKKQLEVSEERPDIKMVASSVIMRDPNDPFYGFSIDKGYLAGVSVNDPVITENGLVGIVRKVYATTSMVECILSENVKVAVLSKEFDESGVVSSDVLMASSGAVRMNYLASDTKLEPGCIITTSGASGDFPEDIVVGYVESIEKAEKDVSRYAIVRPYEDLKTFKEVLVVTGFPGKDEETPDVDLDLGPEGNEDPEGEN